VEDEKRGAELNVMETLVWYGAIPQITVMKQQLFFASSRN
jgi:hypothetical protein